MCARAQAVHQDQRQLFSQLLIDKRLLRRRSLAPHSRSSWPSTLDACDQLELLNRPTLPIVSTGAHGPGLPLVASIESFGPCSFYHDYYCTCCVTGGKKRGVSRPCMRFSPTCKKWSHYLPRTIDVHQP